MTKFDNAHPDGIQIVPDVHRTSPAPVSVRMMTEEERKQYGLAQPRTEQRSKPGFEGLLCLP